MYKYNVGDRVTIVYPSGKTDGYVYTIKSQYSLSPIHTIAYYSLEADEDSRGTFGLFAEDDLEPWNPDELAPNMDLKPYLEVINNMEYERGDKVKIPRLNQCGIVELCSSADDRCLVELSSAWWSPPCRCQR